jgi:hypothetical protein
MVDDGGGALFVYDGETFDGLALWKLKLEDVQVIGLRHKFSAQVRRSKSHIIEKLGGEKKQYYVDIACGTPRQVLGNITNTAGGSLERTDALPFGRTFVYGGTGEVFDGPTLWKMKLEEVLPIGVRLKFRWEERRSRAGIIKKLGGQNSNYYVRLAKAVKAASAAPRRQPAPPLNLPPPLSEEEKEHIQKDELLAQHETMRAQIAMFMAEKEQTAVIVTQNEAMRAELLRLSDEKKQAASRLSSAKHRILKRKMLPEDATPFSMGVAVALSADGDMSLPPARRAATGRGRNQRVARTSAVVDSLFGGKLAKCREKAIIKRRGISPRTMAAAVDGGRMTLSGCDELREKNGEKGTAKKRNREPSVVPTPSSTRRVLTRLDDAADKAGFIVPTGKGTFEPRYPVFLDNWLKIFGYQEKFEADPEGGWRNPEGPQTGPNPLTVKFSADELPCFDARGGGKGGGFNGARVKGRESEDEFL